ncbi:GSCFA domain-containing protein [Flavobacterium sufflavum]|uniref:GSCFA domain-containing protein n=1 Tax=Flavobacterium sufflavum TaxID=1921138 RepID=A0A437KYL6_9FLAO|nr:GSCFA domain-containing protein [Flavobacterium sufflavum]RVT77718.1 GSCFA domain-containing protein [Flavobacterium sufflavum]
MQFRTPIPILESIFPIDYNSKIMSVGSCFAVNMAEKWDNFKFQNSCNPFGIIFNPVSIEKLVERIVNKRMFTESDIFFHNDLWHCFEIHSELSNPDKEAFLHSLNQLIHSTNQQITEATHFLFTYGTAWVYRNIESKQIVANCHKVPQKQFTKELVSIERIQTAIQNTIRLIQSINPAAKFIFTVSPVRHIKDGFVENTLSKSHLISAIHSTHPDSYRDSQLITYNYFPSYEIMMDELRDYRFYAEDMLHPSQVAIDYIWQRFKETSISKTAFAIMDEVEGIQKGLSHRPFNQQSESHQKFIAKLQIRITKLHSEYPFMKF